MTKLIDPRSVPRQSPDDLVGLHAHLAQLIGEPFRFARVSYGDEMTLHFGDLRPARSPRLHQQPYGAFILGLRASPWVLKAGSEPLVLTAGAFLDSAPAELGRQLSKEELESSEIVAPESRVLLASPFVVRPDNGIALHLRFSEGGSLMILPAAPEVEAPGDETLPELADWELLSPRGLLSVGPGMKWTFEPRADSVSGPT